MIIAIDYDNAYEDLTESLHIFTEHLHENHHKILIVSRRPPAHHKRVEEQVLAGPEHTKHFDIICTDGHAKQPYLKQRGHEPDLWITSNPKSLLFSQ